MMKIALLHFHLKRGGVTTVIRRQLAALAGRCEFMLLCGAAPPEPLDCPVAVVPELGYDTERPGRQAPAAVAQAVEEAVFSRWSGGCDVLHVHNALMAKNRDLLDVLARLQQHGMRLFVHIHDFAEDGRPHVYFRQEYPADCHYGVINSRDHELLLRAGLRSDGLHLIPNAVVAPGAADAVGQPEEHPPRVLYPVRAIRRKNVGEALLLSLFFESDWQLAFTLPPNSPADIQSYRDWKAFAAANGLPAVFEAGLERAFAPLVAGSRLILTTSITEGFGFCYTEPWLYAKPLWGRVIPEICRDFTGNGLRLDHLYARLEVPLDWFDRRAFFEKWRSAVRAAAGSFGIPAPTQRTAAAEQSFRRRGRIDFGLLDEAAQRQAIEHLLADPGARKKLAAQNPALADRARWTPGPERIAHNRRVVREHYDLARYGRRLLSVYRQVVQRPVRQRIDKRTLLDLFFDPQNFSLLKWRAYADG